MYRVALPCHPLKSRKARKADRILWIDWCRRILVIATMLNMFAVLPLCQGPKRYFFTLEFLLSSRVVSARVRHKCEQKLNSDDEVLKAKRHKIGRCQQFLKTGLKDLHA